MLVLLGLIPPHVKAQSPAPSETRVYALSHLDANTARAQLTAALGDTARFAQVLADEGANRLIIAAPASVHEMIVPLVAQLDKPAEPAPTVKEVIQLRTLQGAALHERLQKVLGRPLPTQRDATGQWLGFTVGEQHGKSVTLWANQQSGDVQILGTPEQVRSWRHVLTALDTPADASTTTRVVVPRKKTAAKVRQAAGLLSNQPVVAQTVQNETATQGGEASGEAEAEPPGNLLGPVQIETVEGTDIIVLRGNPRDVERVMEVIQEIERMAETAEPRVEVVPLEHIDSEALAALLQRLFDDALSTSTYGYGELVAVPLVKPNAVLLVGQDSTVEKASEILKMLDKPGQLLTQFELFRLKYAQAEAARDVLIDLFTAPPGEGPPTLGPKALVIADSRTNSLIVRASPRDMDEIRRLIEDLDREGSDTVNELRVFKLKNIPAEDLEDALNDAFEPDQDNEELSKLLRFTTIDAAGKKQLTSGVLTGVRVTANQGANALIVSAPPEAMHLLAELIKQLDQMPDVGIDLRVFTIVNGDAVALTDMLLGLFGDQQQQQGGAVGGGVGGAAAQQLTALRVVVDERTNSIIVAGSSEDLLTVEAILRTLDAGETRQRQNRVYRLKNKYVVDVAEALNEWLRAERQVQGTAPGTASPFQQIEREVVIVPEISSNSLIVSATPRYYDEIARLIQQLDAQDPMVMIQVLIAEISLGDLDEFGVEFGLQDSLLFDRSLLGDILTTTTTTAIQDGGNLNTVEQQVIQSATLTPGFNFGDPAQGLGNSGSDTSLVTAGNAATQALSSFGVSRVSSEGGFGGLVLSASSNSVSMLLRALQQSRRVEVLSRPQIMALDNQTGYAFVGQVVPFISQSILNEIGTPQNTIERVNVGLNLEVTPRISPDNLVVMNVYAANNRLQPISTGVPVAIAPNGDPILSPIVDSIEARTVVSAMSGQTVVLSGLLRKEDRALHRRVPLLADIPLVGELFRYDSVATTRNELLIVLTPHVIRSRTESDMIKQVESARMSWCLSDVIDMHGPVGLRSRQDPAGAAQAETIYPEPVPAEQWAPTFGMPQEK
jgi:type II secretion system protein D